MPTVSHLLGCRSWRFVHTFASRDAAGRKTGSDTSTAAGRDARLKFGCTELETALADSLYSGYIEKQKIATERVNHHDALESAGKLSVQFDQRPFK